MDVTTIEDSLKRSFQEATEAECKRFALGFGQGKGNIERAKEICEQKMEDYLDWRMRNGLDYEDIDDGVNKEGEGTTSDADDWKFAVQKAWDIEQGKLDAKELAAKTNIQDTAKLTEEVEEIDYDKELEDAIAEKDEMTEEEKKFQEETNGDDQEISAQKIVPSDLDQVIFLQDDSESSGGRILHVLPGLINRRLAPASIYSNVFSFYLDRKLDRSNLERVTVLIDVRAGEGWPNIPAITLVKFINTCARVLQAKFPERVEKLIICPVPRISLGVWHTCKLFLHRHTYDRAVLFCGPAAAKSALPKDRLKKHISQSILEQIETSRIRNFKVLEENEKYCVEKLNPNSDQMG